ncbi:hypothetical protein E4T56_gene13230 [Termitomyces sp. T112]|nr:hypothetical protein E4T56_gene13230 [Termitomyces sp. T112]
MNPKIGDVIHQSGRMVLQHENVRLGFLQHTLDVSQEIGLLTRRKAQAVKPAFTKHLFNKQLETTVKSQEPRPVDFAVS